MKLIEDAKLLARYLADPLGVDAEVRQAMRIPEDAYYTVSVWPIPGRVDVDRPGSRSVPKSKISKSTQP